MSGERRPGLPILLATGTLSLHPPQAPASTHAQGRRRPSACRRAMSGQAYKSPSHPCERGRFGVVGDWWAVHWPSGRTQRAFENPDFWNQQELRGDSGEKCESGRDVGKFVGDTRGC